MRQGVRRGYAYDGSNNIKRVQDPAGRISSFTVNTSGDLIRMTKPNLTITKFGRVVDTQLMAAP